MFVCEDALMCEGVCAHTSGRTCVRIAGLCLCMNVCAQRMFVDACMCENILRACVRTCALCEDVRAHSFYTGCTVVSSCEGGCVHKRGRACVCMCEDMCGDVCGTVNAYTYDVCS